MSTPVLYFEDDFLMNNYEVNEKKDSEKKPNNNTNQEISQKKDENNNTMIRHKSLGTQNIKRNNNINKVSFDDKIDIVDVESYKEFNKLLFIDNLIEEENEESMCFIF